MVNQESTNNLELSTTIDVAHHRVSCSILKHLRCPRNRDENANVPFQDRDADRWTRLTFNPLPKLSSQRKIHREKGRETRKNTLKKKKKKKRTTTGCVSFNETWWNFRSENDNEDVSNLKRDTFKRKKVERGKSCATTVSHFIAWQSNEW